MSNITVAIGAPVNEASSTYKTVILKGDQTFAEQVTEGNTIYVIRWNFDLNGGSITIPQNCVLKFDGGSVNNGTIDINGAAIFPDYNTLENDSLTISGIPAPGTFWYHEKPMWSNGVEWMDATYNLGVLGIMKKVDLTSDMVANEQPLVGTQTNVVYVNDTQVSYHVSVSNTSYRTPDANIITITVPAGGYGEVNFLNINGIIYARGI